MTGLPAFAAALRPSRGLAPRSVRIKDLYFPNGPGATDLYRCAPGAAGERRCQTADAVSYVTSE